jgi:hypothetical protein
LDLYADRTRQLPVADPDGHALMVSCGGALELARLGLAEVGYASDVQRRPEPDEPDLLARIVVRGNAAISEDTRSRAAAARRRHSERRPFAKRPVPTELLDRLAAAVREDDRVFLHVVEHSDEQLDLAVLVSRADEALHNDPAYREELARWTRRGPADDGVPASAIPHVVGDEPRHTSVPVRDFEVGVTGRLSIEGGGQDEHPALGVIMTADRGDLGALRAGEALARVLVNAEAEGLAASIISQPVDWPVVRERMRGLMSWAEYPQILVRIGWPAEREIGEPTPRRPVSDVIETNPE